MFDTIFLDLEDTVIESWHSPYYTNLQKVRKWLKDNTVTEVGIFSFAIHNDADKAIFDQQMRVGLTDALGIRITTWPSVLEMMTIDTKYTGDHWVRPGVTQSEGVTDYVNMRGKQNAFINFVNATLPNSRHAALLDDIVEDVTLTYRNTGRQISMVNVLKL